MEMEKQFLDANKMATPLGTFFSMDEEIVSQNTNKTVGDPTEVLVI